MGLLRKIERATPLFVAAFQRHNQIVRYLLEKGADVTAKTSNKSQIEFDGLTPLYGAVLEHGMLTHRLGPFNKQRAEKNAIVLSLLEFGADLSASSAPLWMNQLCGVETTMTLINHGLDLKQHDPTSGRTVLHHWASLPYGITHEGALTIVKLLMEKGADVMARDNFGFTPIIRAAMSLGPHLYFALLDLFLERDDVAIMEKIEAMEQAGVNILIFHMNSPHVPKAFEYWRRATHLRQTKGACPYLQMSLLGAVKWTALDQLEHIIPHSSKDEIKLQLFLVQLRIRSGRSWKSVKLLLEAYMGDSAFEYMEFKGKYLELLDIYYAMLNTILLFQPSEKGIWSTSVRVVGSLIYTLWNFNISNPTLLNLEIIKKSIHLILATDKFRSADREREPHVENRYSGAMFTFLTMLLGLPEMLDDIWESLLKLFRHLGSHKLGSLLLMACKDYKNTHYSSTIRLLLQLGANLDTADEDGNRPLHLVAQADGEQSEAAGCLLLGYGAQQFRINNSGKTAVDLWIERNADCQDEEERAAESFGRPDWCRTVRKLKCLSAGYIRLHNVPYKDESELFQDSHSFIKNH